MIYRMYIAKNVRCSKMTIVKGNVNKIIFIVHLGGE